MTIAANEIRSNPILLKNLHAETFDNSRKVIPFHTLTPIRTMPQIDPIAQRKFLLQFHDASREKYMLSR